MGFLDRIKDWMTAPDDYTYEEETADHQDNHQPVEEPPVRPALRRERYAPSSESTTPTSNVIGMASAIGVSQIYMMEPRHFDEMSDAVRALHERKTVVLNMTLMDPDQAQRSVDFVAGATHALGGDLERVGDSIFIFAPSNVQLMTPNSANETPIPKVRPSRTPAHHWDQDVHPRFARS